MADLAAQEDVVAGTMQDAPRQFVPEAHVSHSGGSRLRAPKTDEAASTLIQHVHESSIGENALVRTPFGLRRMTYADHTASGRASSLIEDHIRAAVLPLYGNVHSGASQTGYQSTLFRAEARAIVRAAVGASDRDTVLFCGSGATGAVDKLVGLLGAAGATTRILPVSPHKDAPSGPDRDALEAALRAARDEEHRPLTVVVLSAASNVTGILVDTDALTRLAHKYGAISVWDYAAAAPHCPMRMSAAVDDPAALLLGAGGGAGDGSAAAGVAEAAQSAKDALFFSPHKFCGGPGTPGVLVLKHDLLARAARAHQALAMEEDGDQEEGGDEGRARCGGSGTCAPVVPGGGTVFFVRHDGTPRYLANIEDREEGGTPDIVGAIRAGLALHLHMSVGPDRIFRLESDNVGLALSRWNRHPGIAVLGRPAATRVAIASLVFPVGGAGARFGDPRGGVRLLAPGRRFLHWGFVSALLSDLFGIQCRGGCLCAGPYALRLLGMSEDDAARIEARLLAREELLRPGFVRVSLPYHLPAATLEFVVRAVEWCATHGQALLHEYAPVADTAEWRHQTWRRKERPRLWLQSLDFSTGDPRVAKGGLPVDEADPAETPDETPEIRYARYFAEADARVEAAREQLPQLRRRQMWGPELEESLLSETGRALRWFVLPGDGDEAASSAAAAAVSTAAAAAGGGGDGVDGATAASAADDGDDDSDDDSDDEGGFLLGLGGAADEIGEGIPDPAPAYPTETWGAKHSPLFARIPGSLFSKVQFAIAHFRMIRPGDRLVLGLSGGKDSLSLLHILAHIQRVRRYDFELGACTVDPQSPGFDARALVAYCKALGVPYVFESQPLIALAETHMTRDSICAWCSRMKRGILYSVCRRVKANVLVLAQHADDLAESFVMSAFHNGLLRTMKAHYLNEDKDVRIIRPLVFTRERALRAFAETAKLPVIEDNCPACFSAPTERYRTKQLLRAQEALFPDMVGTICRAIAPLMLDRSGAELIREGTAALERAGLASAAASSTALDSMMRGKRTLQRQRQRDRRRREQQGQGVGEVAGNDEDRGDGNRDGTDRVTAERRRQLVAATSADGADATDSAGMDQQFPAHLRGLPLIVGADGDDEELAASVAACSLAGDSCPTNVREE